MPSDPKPGTHSIANITTGTEMRTFRVSALVKSAPWVRRGGRGRLHISPHEVRFGHGRFMRFALSESRSAPIFHLDPEIVFVPSALPGGGFDLMLRPAERTTFAIVSVSPWRARAVRTALEAAHFELVRRRPWSYFGVWPANIR